MEKIYRTKNTLTVILWWKKYHALGLMIERKPMWFDRKIVFTIELELLVASIWFTRYEKELKK